MREIQALAVLVALLGLFGCEQGPCPVEDQVFRFYQQGIFLVGQPAQLTLKPLVKGGCEVVDRSLSFTVSAQVVGPDFQPLASEARVGAPGEPTTVDFTPERPGRHRAVVTFAPVGGTHQFDVFAAIDRSAEVRPTVLPGACTTLQRTLHGAWVCNGAVVRGNTVTQQFDRSEVVVAGDVVWVVDGTSVRRFVDTGEALTLTASAQHSHGTALYGLASAEELVVVHGSVLQRITFDGQGQLTSSDPSPWDSASAVGNPGDHPKAFLLRDGDELAVVSLLPRPSGVGYLPIRVCPYRLVSGVITRTIEECFTIPENSVTGFEANVLWTGSRGVDSSGRNTHTLHRWVWVNGQLVKQGSLLLVLDTELVYNRFIRNTVPVLWSLHGERAAVVTWSAEQGALLLEHLDAEMLDPVASPTLLWGVTPLGTSRAYVRPPSL